MYEYLIAETPITFSLPTPIGHLALCAAELVSGCGKYQKLKVLLTRRMVQPKTDEVWGM
jgi:hypothetical protein